jgi:hypothetical protein
MQLLQLAADYQKHLNQLNLNPPIVVELVGWLVGLKFNPPPPLN